MYVYASLVAAKARISWALCVTELPVPYGPWDTVLLLYVNVMW
jgi:hypothetical protein